MESDIREIAKCNCELRKIMTKSGGIPIEDSQERREYDSLMKKFQKLPVAFADKYGNPEKDPALRRKIDNILAEEMEKCK